MNRADQELVIKEIEILSMLNEPGQNSDHAFPKLIEYQEDPNFIFVVTQFMESTSLQSLIKDGRLKNQQSCQLVMKNLIEAVNKLHIRFGIVH